MKFEALLVVSSGGPESHEAVTPFLENVLRGRLLTVAEHYYHFDGKSPINDQIRQLMAAIDEDFREHGFNLPIYWGNRNWHPLLADTLRPMRSEGIEHALAFVTSAYIGLPGLKRGSTAQ
jgi:ferrochelatase